MSDCPRGIPEALAAAVFFRCRQRRRSLVALSPANLDGYVPTSCERDVHTTVL
jgi:hypothetical protein